VAEVELAVVVEFKGVTEVVLVAVRVMEGSGVRVALMALLTSESSTVLLLAMVVLV
jgi:hypothetical protein